MQIRKQQRLTVGERLMVYKRMVRADKCIMLSSNGNIEREVDSMSKETVGEYFPSKFLKAEDIKADTPVTITRLEEEVVGDDTKPVVHFNELSKGLVMNKTNGKLITEALGTDRIAEWIGKKITLFRTQVPFGDEMKPAIRVKSADEQSASSSSKIDKALEAYCGDEPQWDVEDWVRT